MMIARLLALFVTVFALVEATQIHSNATRNLKPRRENEVASRNVDVAAAIKAGAGFLFKHKCCLKNGDWKNQVFENLPQTDAGAKTIFASETTLAADYAKLSTEAKLLKVYTADLTNCKDCKQGDIGKERQQCNIFRCLNGVLGGRSDHFGDACKADMKHFGAELKKAIPLFHPNKAMVVYRGYAGASWGVGKLKLHDIVHQKAFWSTTSVEKIAKDWSKPEKGNGILFELTIPAGVGADVESISAYPEEKEVLLKADQYFKVTSVTAGGNGTPEVVKLAHCAPPKPDAKINGAFSFLSIANKHEPPSYNGRRDMFEMPI